MPPSHTAPGRSRFCSRICKGLAARIPLADRFWAKVNKDGPIIRPDLGPCWLWTGAHHAFDSYGVIEDAARGRLYAHRLSLELADGRLLGPGEDALHKCDYPPCVRPDHLFRGTQAANNADRDSKDRVRHGDGHASAKLTAKSVEKIRTLYATGEISHRQLGALFGVSHGTIADAIRGKT